MTETREAAHRRAGRGRPIRSRDEISYKDSSAGPALTVYVAAPVRIRQAQDLYRRRLAQVRERYPQAVVVDSLSEFVDLHDWLDRWPHVLRSVDRVVFMADWEGCVGAGTLKEVLDAVVQRKPVELVTDASFVTFGEIQLRGLSRATARRACSVEVVG